MSHVKLSPDVAELLGQSTITADLLVLPPGQLDRKLYESVAKAIKAAGGKWNKQKGGFIFDSDPRAKLGLALSSGLVVDDKVRRQAFYTPAALAEEIAELADVAGYYVLEPSAGDGALADACRKAGAHQVACIEMEPTCREKLSSAGHSVEIADFLTVLPRPQFKRIVMNPPFSKGADVRHVTRAVDWLAPGGTLHAVLPDKEHPKLAALGAYTVKRFDAGTFKSSGTMIRTRLICIERAALN